LRLPRFRRNAHDKDKMASSTTYKLSTVCGCACIKMKKAPEMVRVRRKIKCFENLFRERDVKATRKRT